MDAPLKERYREAVMAYLNFSATHQNLAGRIADEAVARIEGTSLAGSARLTFEQKVALAAHACIRHRHTTYDDIFIEKNLEHIVPPHEKMAPPHSDPGHNEVFEFIKKHRE